MNQHEKELVKLVKAIGEGSDIAELSAQSFWLGEFDNFEAHEIHDIAKGSSAFRYEEDSQKVYLA